MNLRNHSNVSNVRGRTAQYTHSFLPSTIDSWNALPNEAKEITTLDSFKSYLNIDKPVTNPLFYHGSRRAQVLHSRLRTDCSGLNHQLFPKNIIPSPLCTCGSIESTSHYLLICPNFTDIRAELFRSVSHIVDISLWIPLYGDENLSVQQNQRIFDAMHCFIIASKRFDN